MNKVVEQFYDNNPYPGIVAGSRVTISKNAIQNDFRLVQKPVPSALRILVAGCGTVAAQAIAKAYPDAHIICAVDISSESLKVAQKNTKLAIKNRINYIKADLAEFDLLNNLPETQYDWIHCTGVLHHLTNPLQGIENISKLLAPKGVIRLQLYSKGGRTWIEWARKLFLQKNAKSSRDIHLILTGLSKHHPFRYALATYPETLNSAGLKDGFLHSQVNTFYAQEWQEMCNSCGLNIAFWNNLHYLFDVEDILPASFLDNYNNLGTAEKITVMEKMGEWRSDFKALAVKSDIIKRDLPANKDNADYLISGKDNISYSRYYHWQNFKSAVKQFNTDITKDDLKQIIEHLNYREWFPGLTGLMLRLKWSAISDRCKTLASPKYLFKDNIELLIEDFFNNDEQLYIPDPSTWSMEQWVNGFYRWNW